MVPVVCPVVQEDLEDPWVRWAWAQEVPWEGQWVQEGQWAPVVRWEDRWALEVLWALGVAL